MKIEKHLLTRMRLEDFADEHGLVMEVYEREENLIPFHGHFYVQFKGVKVEKGAMLYGVSGEGNTIEAAISDYAQKISHKTIVINAMHDDRREIEIPLLSYEKPNHEDEKVVAESLLSSDINCLDQMTVDLEPDFRAALVELAKTSGEALEE